ncbi:hypothetical protein C8Q76DRAFT_705437 [Earliella scabrosa]|nr:hypothetical protein C8Q76DRAFT_705437 [Earliella scabrosa]
MAALNGFLYLLSTILSLLVFKFHITTHTLTDASNHDRPRSIRRPQGMVGGQTSTHASECLAWFGLVYPADVLTTLRHAQFEEPGWQTIDFLQTAKAGEVSYMGEYRAVWSGVLVGDHYASPEDLPASACFELKCMLKGPQPQLQLSFEHASYLPAERRTVVHLKLNLTCGVQRWETAPCMIVQREGDVSCAENCPSSNVRWRKNDAPTDWFPNTTTHLGFTMEVDSSPLRAPFVYNEKARLGIGMSNKELEVAHILAMFQSQWVEFPTKNRKARSTWG